MHRLLLILLVLMVVLPLGPPLLVSAQGPGNLAACRDCAFSCEEDFISQGPLPPDGNPLISDGDLLSCSGAVCLRNAQLLQPFDVTEDLGLDAVDVLDVERGLVSFSTELDSPHGNFSQGDLLSTWGTIIPNRALLILFQIEGDRGLDAVHWVGDIANIADFHEWAKGISPDEWLGEPGRLSAELKRYGIDIWFSIEGTEWRAATVPILDGDLLSAANGTIVAGNSALLPPSVPGGLPNRGVDFGLDAVTATRSGRRTSIRYSTEILYRSRFAFTDGDLLRIGDGLSTLGENLYKPFEPKAVFLGTDAFYQQIPEEEIGLDNFIALVFKLFTVRQPMITIPSDRAPANRLRSVRP
ncbi:MAG: hypothetical protein H5T69_09390 [Chloroflexi bacterium]|nr:hypothetical protein [Chloroflexota bacterium]